MRAPFAILLAALAAPLFLVACSGDQESPSAPSAAPAIALSATRPAALDPSHDYLFSLACSSSAAPNSSVLISTATNIPNIYVTCNSWTELGAAYGTAFGSFGYEIALDSLGLDKTCAVPAVTTTGTFRCRAKKFSAMLTVTDEGAPSL